MVKARAPIALAVALAAGCGGLLIINEPPDAGEPPCCDGGLPDGGQPQNGPPNRTRTTLVVLPDTTVVADGVTAVTVRVIVRDAAGHLLRGVGVTVTCDGTGNSFLPASGSGYTATDGSFETALVSTIAEPKTVAVAVDTFTLTAQLDFIAGQPDPSNSSLVLSPAPPTTIVADGALTASVTATLRDAYSNIVVNHPVSFTSTGSGNVFTPGGPVSTDTAGVARTRLASTRAEAKTVVATVGSLFVMTQPVTFVAGGASQARSSLNANPTVLPANGTSTTTLTVTARDANGNPVGSKPVTFVSSGSGDTFIPGNTDTTNVDGVARVQMSSTVAETKTITAQAAGLNLTTSVLFGVGNPSNGNSSLDVETPVAADGVDDGLITVHVRDGTNNPVVGQNVTLIASGSLNTFTPASSGNTNAAGDFTARLKSVVAETKAVTANVGGAFSLTNFMQFNSGAPSAAASQMSASPTHVRADGVAAITLSMVFRDGNGNPVPGLPVTLSSTGSSNTFSTIVGTTDVDGAFSVTLKSTKAELKTVSAAGGGITLQTSVAFDPGPPAAATSTVSITPNNIIANGWNYTNVTATMRDALGNPVPNVQVTLSASGSNNYYEPSTPVGLTGSGGVYQARMNSTRAETKTIYATCAGIAPTTTVTFVPGFPNNLGSSLAINPTQVTANGSDYATVTMTVRDINLNVIPNCTVTFITYNPTRDHWSPSGVGISDANGVYSAQLSSMTAEQKSVSANACSYATLNAQVTFVPP